MRNNLIVFFLGFLALIVFVSQIRFPDIVSDKQIKPDFILTDSVTKHYKSGKWFFTVQAKRIEIFKKKFLLYNAKVTFNNGVIIQSDKMEADFKHASILATSHVQLYYRTIKYMGEKVAYLMNEHKISAEDGGQILIKGDVHVPI